MPWLIFQWYLWQISRCYNFPSLELSFKKEWKKKFWKTGKTYCWAAALSLFPPGLHPYSHLQPQPLSANYIHGQLNFDVTRSCPADPQVSQPATHSLPVKQAGFHSQSQISRQWAMITGMFLSSQLISFISLQMCFNFIDTTNRFLKWVSDCLNF